MVKTQNRIEFSLRTKLLIMVALLLGIPTFGGVIGIGSLYDNNQRMSEIFERRVLPLTQLSAISDVLALQRESLAIADGSRPDAGGDRIVAENLKAYRQHVDGAELAQAESLAKAVELYRQTRDAAHDALLTADSNAQVRTRDAAHAAHASLRSQLQKLVSTQREESQALYNACLLYTSRRQGIDGCNERR